MEHVLLYNWFGEVGKKDLFTGFINTLNSSINETNYQNSIKKSSINFNVRNQNYQSQKFKDQSDQILIVEGLNKQITHKRMKIFFSMNMMLISMWSSDDHPCTNILSMQSDVVDSIWFLKMNKGSINTWKPDCPTRVVSGGLRLTPSQIV